MKLRRAASLFLAGLLFLSGCTRPETQVQREEPITFDQQPAIVEELLHNGGDTVSANVQVHVPEAFFSGQGNAYDAKILGIADSDLLKKIFLGDREIIKTEGNASSNFNYYVAEKEFLHLETLTFGYHTAVGRAIYQAALYDRSKYDNKLDSVYTEFDNTGNLDFQPREEVLQEAFALAESLGAEPSADCQCYAIPHTQIAEKEQALLEQQETEDDGMPKVEPYGEWTEKEDCYFLRIPLLVDGYPLTQFDHGEETDGSGVPGFFLELLYTRDGLVDASGVVLRDFQKTAENQDLLTAEEALETVREYYESLVTGEEDDSVYQHVTEIRDAYLEMVPQRKNGSLTDYTVAPAWRFEIWSRSELKEGMIAPEGIEVSEDWGFVGCLFVDARTGERIR